MKYKDPLFQFSFMNGEKQEVVLDFTDQGLKIYSNGAFIANFEFYEYMQLWDFMKNVLTRHMDSESPGISRRADEARACQILGTIITKEISKRRTNHDTTNHSFD